MDGAGDGDGGVAEDVGAPGADVIDVGFAVDVLDAGSFTAADEEGVAIDIAEGADGGIDASGDEGFGFGEELLGEGSVHGETFNSSVETGEGKFFRIKGEAGTLNLGGDFVFPAGNSPVNYLLR